MSLTSSCLTGQSALSDVNLKAMEPLLGEVRLAEPGQ